MPTASYIVGLDLGTTALKAVVFRNALECQRFEYTYPLYTTQPGEAVHSLADIRLAFKNALDSLEAFFAERSAAPDAVGFSNAMHSLITVDGHGASAVYTWADSRATTRGLPRSTNYHRTGVPYHPMAPSVKIAWLREQCDSRDWQRVSGVKEELLLEYFGTFWTDTSTAATTGLLHLDGGYDETVLAALGLKARQLPQVQPVEQILPALREPYLSQYPRLARAAWVIGANDAVAACNGLGISGPDRAGVSIGTSAAIRTFTASPQLDGAARLFCYRADDRYLVGAPSNSGGIILSWLREVFETPLDLTGLLTSSTPGANGLLCLPYLAGERAPFWDSESSGAYLGLRLHHTRQDLMRAAIEGTALQLAWLKDILTETTGPLDEIRVTGGLTRSSEWVQLLADVFGQPVALAQESEFFEGSAFGAAHIAARALGMQFRVEREYARIEPSTDAVLYERVSARYREAASMLSANYAE